MLTVILSITFKGHDLTGAGCMGLALAISALLVEIEGKVARFRGQMQGSSKPDRRRLQRQVQRHLPVEVELRCKFEDNNSGASKL